MDHLNIISRGEDFVFAREKDQLRALATMVMNGTLAPSLGTETLFGYTERMLAAIEADCYGIYYEVARSRNDNGQVELPVPVGFVTWARLSQPMGVVFAERLRPLHKSEYNSGKQLWMIDLVGPLGHGNEIRQCFEKLFEDHEDFQATRKREGKWRRETHKNLWRAQQQKLKE